MRSLNRAAAEALGGLGPGTQPHAVTDVTGFGLLGHGWEMAERSNTTLVLQASAVPLYDGAKAAAERGVRTGGDARNRAYLEGHVTIADGVSEAAEALAYDPQTSGGLLASVSPDDAERLVAEHGFTVVGRVVEGPAAVELV